MEQLKRNIAGLILAAGEGSRIGKTKALIKIDGLSFLRVIAANLKESGYGPVLSVCGANYEEVQNEALQVPIDCVLNSDWKRGQFSSLKAGLKSLRDDICGVLITLVDHPFVMLHTYKKLLDAFVKSPLYIVKPVFDKRSGHPIIIPRDIVPEILGSPDNSMLRDILNKYENRTCRIEVDDPGVLRDIDTGRDLENENCHERCR